MQRKHFFSLTALSLLLLFFTLYSKAQTYTIATYNLRYGSANDNGNMWNDRKNYMFNLIRYHDFDIFGTQEGLPEQLNELATALPQYSRYGKGRDDGSDKGEHSAIFYKNDKFRLLNSGDFWLSETPDKPGLGWDATCCNRICSWVYLQDKKSKKKFYFFNLHLDHQGKTARLEGSKLVLKKIEEIAKGAPAVLTGDFNAERSAAPYKIIAGSAILRDSYKDVQYPYENNGSFNAFKSNAINKEVIDHIFISRQFKATKWGILTDTYFGKFPSDHFPVEAVVILR